MRLLGALAVLVAIAALPQPAAARAVGPDPSFGRDGFVIQRAVAGPAHIVGTLPGGSIVRLTPDPFAKFTNFVMKAVDRRGRPLPAFGRHVVHAAALDGDGVVAVDALPRPGDDPNCGYDCPTRVVRLTADGQPDPGFGAGGTVTLPDPLPGQFGGPSLLLASGGAVLVVGSYQGPECMPSTMAVQRLVGGALDVGYGAGGALIACLGGGFLKAAIAAPDRSLVVGARSIRDLGMYMHRFTPAGADDPTPIDPRWPASITDESRTALAALADGGRGRLLVGVHGDQGLHVLRLLRDGSRDESFRVRHWRRAGGPLVNEWPLGQQAIARDRRGRVLVGVTRIRAAVWRLGRRGRIDRSFGKRGRIPVRPRGFGVIIDDVRALGRGRVLVAGAALAGGREPVSHPLLARLRG